MCRKPSRDDQADEGAAPLEHGVRGDGRAVQDRVELGEARRPPAPRRARMPSITPTDWSSGVLGVFASQTRWPLAVVEEDVRERPADVDSEAVGHARLAREAGGVAVLLHADVAAARVALEVLDPALARADLADHGARRLVALLEGHGLEELPDPEPAGVARRAAGREDVVRADRLVAVGDGRRLAEEERAVVAHPLEVPARVGGLDLDVLERVRVGERERLVVRVDDDDLAVVLPRPRRDVGGRAGLELHVDLAQRLLGERPATS